MSACQAFKGVASPEISIRTIYRGIIPFVTAQLAGLALLILGPSLVLWLPDAVLGDYPVKPELYLNQKDRWRSTETSKPSSTHQSETTT